jgi:hypothetical protein
MAQHLKEEKPKATTKYEKYMLERMDHSTNVNLKATSTVMIAITVESQNRKAFLSLYIYIYIYIWEIASCSPYLPLDDSIE